MTATIDHTTDFNTDQTHEPTTHSHTHPAAHTPTEAQQAAPQSPSAPSAPPFMRLSDLVQQFDVTQRYVVLRQYKEALRQGTLKAIPLTSSFTLEMASETSSTLKQSRRQDEAIQAGPTLEKWIERARQQFHTKPETRSLAVSFEDLLSGEVDFEKKAQQYRKKLQVKPKSKKAGDA